MQKPGNDLLSGSSVHPTLELTKICSLRREWAKHHPPIINHPTHQDWMVVNDQLHTPAIPPHAYQEPLIGPTFAPSPYKTTDIISPCYDPALSMGPSRQGTVSSGPQQWPLRDELSNVETIPRFGYAGYGFTIGPPPFGDSGSNQARQQG